MPEERIPSQPVPGQAERRAAPRVPSSLKLPCYPVGSGFSERRLVRLRNVSRNGLGVVADRRWDPGTTLILEVAAEEGPPTTIRARVVHATPQMGGCFLMGCTLEHPISDAQVDKLTR